MFRTLFKFASKTKESKQADHIKIPLPFEEIRADRDWQHLMARFFTSDDGRIIFQYLRHLAYSRPNSPEMSEANLRFEAGRRAFYQQICNLVKQGIQK